LTWTAMRSIGQPHNKSLDASGGALNCEFRISNCGFEFAPPRQLNRYALQPGVRRLPKLCPR
jgi:hypothetical protein